MALIRCPECGGVVSDLAESCPHCGYQVSAHTVYANNVVSTMGYDVMLVDHKHNTFTTAKNLKAVLDITYAEAIKLLASAPTYLYSDLEYDDAVYLCRQMTRLGIRTALYSPNGSVTYYTPENYNRVLPKITGIARRPKYTHKPRRIEMVQPIGHGSQMHNSGHSQPITGHNNASNHPQGSGHAQNHSQPASPSKPQTPSQSHGNSGHSTSPSKPQGSNYPQGNNGHSSSPAKPQSSNQPHSSASHTATPSKPQSSGSVSSKPVNADKERFDQKRKEAAKKMTRK